MKKYRIKAENIRKLEKFIQKIENGRNKDKRSNGKRC
jgi:hypothetical protein